MKKIQKATHQGELHIGDIKIPCAVLEDGTRVLRERSIAKSLQRKGGGAHWQRKKSDKTGAFLPEYVSAKNLAPFINEELRLKLINPVTYKTISGSQAQGIKASLLVDICNVWLETRENGALLESQHNTSKMAEILLKGFAHVGIVGLVDEATGYQEVRDRLALQKILEMYIAKELQPWVKTFPDEFYEQLFKLKGWQFKPLSVKRPQVVGRITNDIIYERLERGVLDELKNRTPKDEKGRRKHHFHRLLTDDIGNPKLREHISNVITLMKASASYNNFYRLLQRAMPRYCPGGR